MKKIRYCGNCNPDEDPGEVKKALEVLFPGGDAANVLVDGCSRACLSKKEQDTKNDPGVIVVSSREVMRRMKK
jgi:hypothetical protein